MEAFSTQDRENFLYFDQRINTVQMVSGVILLIGIYLLVREEKAIFRTSE